jgi:ribose-phosphate pyrophosphokinase
MDGQIRLLAGNANRPLAESIARRISMHRGSKVELADADVKPHKDRETHVTIRDNVRGEDVFIIQPTSSPANEHLMELLIMIDAVRRSSAFRITAVIPYYGYARQDRRTEARTPITSKLVANLLTTAGANRVLTMDLHAGQIQGFFDIPTDNLYAAPVFTLDIKHYFKNRENLTIISPDVGGVVRARDIAGRVDAAMALIDKTRRQAGVVEGMTLIGHVEGRDCIIVDDIVDTAGTLCSAAATLKNEGGAASVHAYITHGVLSDPALSRINNSVIDSLVITDSIEHNGRLANAEKIRTAPMAPLLAQAIINVANDTSVSSLFNENEIAPLYEGLYGPA